MSGAPSRVRHMYHRVTKRIRHSKIMLAFMEERSQTLSATATSPWDWNAIGLSEPEKGTIASHNMTQAEGPYWVADGASALPNLLPSTAYYLGDITGATEWGFKFYLTPSDAKIDQSPVSLDTADTALHEMNQAVSDYSIVEGAWKKGYTSQQISLMTDITDFPTLAPVLPIP